MKHRNAFNEKILAGLIARRSTALRAASASLGSTTNTKYHEAFRKWEFPEFEPLKGLMRAQLEENIEMYWARPLRSAAAEKPINFIWLEHGGHQSASAKMAAGHLAFKGRDIPVFGPADKRIAMVDDLNAFSAMTLQPLSPYLQFMSDHAEAFQADLDLAPLYDLQIATSHFIAHKVFEDMHFQGRLGDLKWKSPVYIALGEHDLAGPEMLYVYA